MIPERILEAETQMGVAVRSGSYLEARDLLAEVRDFYMGKYDELTSTIKLVRRDHHLQLGPHRPIRDKLLGVITRGRQMLQDKLLGLNELDTYLMLLADIQHTREEA